MSGSADRPEEPGRRLESWKEIASHFRRDVRTVQRWEAREQMPVHRHLHRDRPAIFAYASELDEWWRQRQPADPAAGAADAFPSKAPPSLATPPSSAATRRLPGRAVTLTLAAVALSAVALVVAFAMRRGPAGVPVVAAEGRPVGRLLAHFTREGAAPVRLGGFEHTGFVLALPNGDLYVTEPFADVVTVVDGRVGTVIRRIPVRGRPARMALAPSGDLVYVACQNGTAASIRTRNSAASSVPGIEWARDVVVTPDGGSAYFALGYAGLARLDVPTGAVERLPAVGCPFHVTTDRTRLYVSCQCQGPGGTPGHDAVVVYDLATRKVVGTAQGPPQVGSTVSVSPDGAFLWANGHDACTAPGYDHAGCPRVPASVVNVYDTATLKPVRSIAVALEEAGEVGVLPGGRRAYVAGLGLRVIATRNFAVAESMAGRMMRRPALSRDGRMVWLLDDREVLGAPALPPACDLPETGLLDHWPGDGAADDVWGVSHGELRGAAGFAPGIVGQAFALDGLDDEVNLGVRHNLQWPIGDATVMAWVKPAVAAGEMAVMGRLGDPGTGLGGWALVARADGRFAFCMEGEAGACGSARDSHRVTGTTRAAPGVWYHVAITRTAAGVARLFVNGTEEADERLEYHFGTSRPELKLGALGAGARWRGLIDEAAHYDRALEPVEIAAIAGMPRDAACRGSR